MSADLLILVVEDAEDVRELLTAGLETAGYHVVSCGEADEAFEAARTLRPALVVTDLMLGVSSGLDLITRLRSDLAPPVPPIVACSGFPAFEAEALARGADLFIPKPFELVTIQRVAASLLDRGHVEEDDQEEAKRSSRTLRALAVESARMALARLGPRAEDLRQRARWAADELQRYFGFGDSVTAVLRDTGLHIVASSNPRLWPLEAPLDLDLCRDILETNSPLVVTDLATLGATLQRPGGGRLRFFVGVPIACGPVAVGVMALTDDQPHRFLREELFILDAVAARASSLLTDVRPRVPALRTASGLTSRDGLLMYLSSELSRATREGLSLALFAFRGQRPEPGRLAERTVLAELARDTYALLVTRDEPKRAGSDVLALLLGLNAVHEIAGAGMLAIEGGVVIPFDEHELLRAAEQLLAQALHAGGGKIERMIIRREALAIKSATVEAADAEARR